MANVIINNLIKQAFINTLFENELVPKRVLEWYWDLSQKGNETLDCLFIPSEVRVSTVHPIDEQGKQFAQMLTLNKGCLVKWNKKRGVFVEVGNRYSVYKLEHLGFDSIEDFQQAYNFKNEHQIRGCIAHLNDSFTNIEEPVKVEKKKEPVLGMPIGRYHTADELFERYKVVASVCEGYQGSVYGLGTLISKELNKHGLYHRSGCAYTLDQIRKLRRSKYCRVLIGTHPVFTTDEERESKLSDFDRASKKMKGEYYYNDLIDIYTTIADNEGKPLKEIAKMLTKEGIMYKRNTPFISAVVSNFRTHVAYNLFLAERNAL